MKEKQQAGNLKDEYTGKKLQLGKDKANLDHVVPRKEIFEDHRRKLAGLETADLANKVENLAPTNESLNKSKGAKSNTEQIEYLKEKRQNILDSAEKSKQKIDANDKMSDLDKRHEKENIDKRTQDKLSANENLMKNVDDKARKAINKDLRNGAIKNTAKEAGKNAMKAMASAALLDLLKEVIQGLVRFFRTKAKSFKTFLAEMKGSIKAFLSKVTNFIRGGATNAVGTVTTEIIEYVFAPIVRMFKHFTSMLKQGISTFVDAIKFLMDKRNRNMPFSIKVAQVGKIVTAGLSAAGAIFLGEAIEKALTSPTNPLLAIFNVKIPLLGTIGNLTGLFLASLISGVIGAIVMNLIDKFIGNKLKEDSSKKIINKQNEILNLQEQEIAVAGSKTEVKNRNTQNFIQQTQENARAVLKRISDNDNIEISKIDFISENKSELDRQQKELDSLSKALDDLL
ncbi:hypothetical protein [Lactococcus lactis]|uniref:hypothetical protein n=1 Tax=Lactococcus lactis TaxID=1358 RepID=UPI0018D4B07F|nr:hypothetical protein [Lactococcus lactis]